MHIDWIWLLAGLIPYSITQHQTKNEQNLKVRAVFWCLTICRQHGRVSWTVSIPLIEHLR